MTVPFNLNQLLDELRVAAVGADAESAVYSLLKHAMQHTDRVLKGMPDFEDNDTILFEDEAVSIWHCRFDPGYTVPAHDHQMFAIIGIYQGTEKNELYKQLADGQLAKEKEIILNGGDVLQIAASDIHAVSCVGEVPCCGVHVYLGCLTTVDRLLFDVGNGNEMKFTDDNYQRLTRANK